MKDFVLISDNEYLDIGRNQRIYVFSNVESYEERIEVLLNNKISLNELEKMVNSWGGSLEIFLLNDLIKSYKKNNDKGLQL